MLSGVFSAFVLIAATGLVPFEPGSVKLGGEIGRHLDLTVEKILHHTDVDRDFVAPFRKRVAAEGTVGIAEARAADLGPWISWRTRDTLKAYDPGLIYLGCRFIGGTPDRIVVAAAKYVDALSNNIYHKDVSDWKLPAGVNKPIVVAI